MSTWIALFRGINVGGKNILPMKELVRELEGLGLEDVRSWIQSGNVVFRSRIRTPDRLAKQIARQVESTHGFSTQVLVLSADDLERAVAANPFPEGETDPKSLHLFFLESEPVGPDLEALASVCGKSERFHHTKSVFYLHAPDGIGRSRLATRVEKILGVVTTARNWRTVTRLQQMVRALCLVLVLCSPAAAGPLFTDVTRQSGLPVIGPTTGLVITDLDLDGRPDLVLGLHDGMPVAFLQRRALRFVPTDWLGDDPGVADHHSTSVADLDRDGRAELYFSCGADHGNGWGIKWLRKYEDGAWTEIAPALGVVDPLGRGRSALFLDVVGSPALDLLVLNFRTAPRVFADLLIPERATDQTSVLFPELEPAPPAPDRMSAGPPPNESRERAEYFYRLVPGYLDDDFRPEFFGWGQRFVPLFLDDDGALHPDPDLLPSSIVGRNPVHGLIADLDGDLRNDLYLVRGDGPPRSHPAYHNDMFLQDSTGRFVVATRESGALLDGTGHRVHAADFDNDGNLDLIILRRRDAMSDRRNVVLRGIGGGEFKDVTEAWGLDVHLGGVSQDLLPCDLDGDGDLDLIIAQGAHALRNASGGFRLFENRATPSGLRSIQFTLKGGPESNAEGFGARVRVYAGARQWIRDHWPAQCEGSAMPLPVHFGLGPAAEVDSVSVIWPDGRRQVARDLPAEGHWLWREGESPRRISR